MQTKTRGTHTISEAQNIKAASTAVVIINPNGKIITRLRINDPDHKELLTSGVATLFQKLSLHKNPIVKKPLTCER